MLNKKLIIPLFITSFTLLAGCGSSSEENMDTGSDTFSIDMQLPDSLTGGTVTQARPVAFKSLSSAFANRASTGEPCAYMGIEDDDDLFENGYKTTRFMVSTMATWTCIADLIIDIADTIEHDGTLVESDNDTQAVDYDPSEPTHYSITDDSDSQTTARMYYGYDRANPPTSESVPEFYISWNETSEDVAQGRMIISPDQMNGDNVDPEDPVNMRMDFDFDENSRSADMFLQFDENNQWADGMRIEIVKDLNASVLGQVYTARGMINMKDQFFNAENISEIPDIQFYTVSDMLGNGAAIQEIQDMSLPLWLNVFENNNLGNYLFTKTDNYFFDNDSDWEYIFKNITSATYRGGRTTPETGGTWLPFNPSQDMIIIALELDNGYFTGDQCGELESSCTGLLNAVFKDGFAEQEQNQGQDPMDWRSTALDNATFLGSVYPNGQDWTGAFDLEFTPDI